MYPIIVMRTGQIGSQIREDGVRLNIMSPKKKDSPNKIHIENFGPISEGEIHLKPLTILIGPNNSGKSFAAMTLHGILNTIDSVLGYRRRRYMRGYSLAAERYYAFPIAISGELRKSLYSMINRFTDGSTSEAVPVDFVRAQTRLLTNSLADVFSHEVERLFGVKSKRLVRFGTEKGLIRSSLGNCCFDFNLEGGKWKTEISPESIPEVRIARRNGRFEVVTSNELGEFRAPVRRFEIDDLGLRPHFLERDIMYALMNHLADLDYGVSYFLPAARSGILQAYLGLAKLLISQSAMAGVRPLEVPGFSGAVADLISTLVTLRPTKAPLYDLARAFEEDSYIGEIKLGRKRRIEIRDIEYRWHGEKTPLSIASSTVTEIAPLILYTKYLLDEESVLMLEEPEAHLHPANQRLMAKYLVHLVKRGVTVVLTTHSEFLVNEFSLCVQASRLDEKRLQNLGYKGLTLSPSDVSVHVTNQESDLSSTISLITVNERGIDQTEFMAVRETLFGDTVRLERELDE